MIQSVTHGPNEASVTEILSGWQLTVILLANTASITAETSKTFIFSSCTFLIQDKYLVTILDNTLYSEDNTTDSDRITTTNSVATVVKWICFKTAV